MLKISTIVPLYNGEKYIVRCLESLTRQAIDPLCHEIIVVNDGSMDNGPSLVMDFQKNHHNVILLNKENGGVSSARNLGLSEAKGEYVHFVDADDLLIEGAYSYLLYSDNNSDIIKFGSVTVDKRVDADCVIGNSNNRPIWKHYQNANDYVQNHGFPSFVWGCLYKRVLLKDICFRSYKIAEDVWFNVELLCSHQDSTISVSSKIVYKYFVHEDSALTSKKRNHLRDLIFDNYAIWENVEQKKEYFPIWNVAFASVQKDLERQAFTRILSGAFPFMEVKKIMLEGIRRHVFPMRSKKTMSCRVIALLSKHPVFVWMLSPFYRHFFLTFIKPLLGRN